MPSPRLQPVLLLGGTGSLGARTARNLRHLHPHLPIEIAGRNVDRLTALAQEIGDATITDIDLTRPDLGLPDSNAYSLVFTGLRDLSLNTMRFAEARKIPYMTVSDGVFEIGPLVARAIHNPEASPVVMVGHGLGAVPTLAALYFARDFDVIDSINIGQVFDPADPLGAASLVDMDRINRVGPPPLVLAERQWKWVKGEDQSRRFTSVDGLQVRGEAVGLMDVLSLSVSAAQSIRVDFAEASTASSRRGGAPSHETIIEITGSRRNTPSTKLRCELIDSQGYASLSARGMTVIIEHLLGLVPNVTVQPGLYLPEMIVDLDYFMMRLRAFGVHINEI